MQLHRERGAIRARGADLAFVGNGAPAFARAFVEEYGIDAPVLTDPTRRTYAALGMGRATVLSLASAHVLRSAGRALRAGFRQGPIRGDTWQLGGVLVVRPGGVVTYRHLAADVGDHPPLGDVLAALDVGCGRSAPAP